MKLYMLVGNRFLIKKLFWGVNQCTYGHVTLQKKWNLLAVSQLILMIEISGLGKKIAKVTRGHLHL